MKSPHCYKEGAKILCGRRKSSKANVMGAGTDNVGQTQVEGPTSEDKIVIITNKAARGRRCRSGILSSWEAKKRCKTKAGRGQTPW